MGLTAMAVATSMYVITALDLFMLRNYAMSVVYAAYSVANCALVWATPEFRLQIQGMVKQFV
jgi:hypothetical protein